MLFCIGLSTGFIMLGNFSLNTLFFFSNWKQGIVALTALPRVAPWVAITKTCGCRPDDLLFSVLDVPNLSALFAFHNQLACMFTIKFFDVTLLFVVIIKLLSFVVIAKLFDVNSFIRLLIHSLFLYLFTYVLAIQMNYYKYFIVPW